MSKVHFKFQAGVEARDTVTGLHGTIVSRVQLVNGCIQYTLQPKPFKEESTYVPDAYSIDEQTIELMHGVVPVPEDYTFKFDTGDKVRHRINGFEGYITTCKLALNGCDQYIIEGKIREGKENIVGAFSPEIELIDKGLNADESTAIKKSSTGGPSTKVQMYTPEQR